MNCNKVRSFLSKQTVYSRSYCSKNNAREISIPVPWGKIAGKWWGSTDIKPILCFHGVQDNCATFDPLIPLLGGKSRTSFLALDLPGHGFSTPFPGGMSYDYLSFMSVFQRIIEFFNFRTVSFMGHSLGAMSSFCYTMLYPQRVDFLICIDSMKIINTPISAKVVRECLERFMKYDKFKTNDEEPLSYTLDEMKQKITNAHRNSVHPEKAIVLMERNIAPSKKFPGKYYFTRDPTLKSKILFHWPQEQILKDVVDMTNPIFICKATNSSYYEPKEYYHQVLDVLRKTSKDCDFHFIDGTHHLHLNEPEKLAPLMNGFLNKHYNEEKIAIDENRIFSKTPTRISTSS